MRQFTTEQKTAKLIELGFEKPKNSLPIREENKGLVYQLRYTIGELIEMLPRYCWYRYGDKAFRAHIQIKFYLSRWHIVYRKSEEEHCGHLYDCGSDELVDALYDMIVRLKEEGVI